MRTGCSAPRICSHSRPDARPPGRRAATNAPPRDPKIWFEVCPIPPRFREGNSKVDLAVGDIAVREDAPGSGIRLDPREDSWTCFCECKWYSDLSVDVTNDATRNQFTRVVENVLCFQHTDPLFPQYVRYPFFALITPRLFTLDQQPPRPMSRLYQYVFRDYRDDKPAALLRDMSGCGLSQRKEDRWTYPDSHVLAKQVQVLVLRWVTYDDLFGGLPESPLRRELVAFWDQHGAYQARNS